MAHNQKVNDITVLAMLQFYFFKSLTTKGTSLVNFEKCQLNVFVLLKTVIND